MIRSRSFLSVSVLMVAALSLRVESAPRCDTHHGQLRTTDGRLHLLIDDGIHLSATFRALIDRLDASDVVVYLSEDMHPHEGIDGRMTFISSAGGMRYVSIRMVLLHDQIHEIALLGHELRHAVEIADAPSVVDAPSLAREYNRIGHERTGRWPPGRAFDTAAAVETGYRVLHEVGWNEAD